MSHDGLQRGQYDWHQMGNQAGAVALDPLAGNSQNKQFTATTNIVLSLLPQPKSIEFKVRIDDGSGLGLLTISFSGTLLGFPLPTIISSSGEFFVFDWDGANLWQRQPQ